MRRRADYIPDPVHPTEQVASAADRFAAENNAKNAGRDAIYSALSHWTSQNCAPGEPIPVVRSGEIVHWIHPSPLANALAGTIGETSPVDSVLNSAFLPSVTELKSEKKAIERLLASLETVMKKARSLDVMPWWMVTRSWSDLSGQPDQSVNVVHAVGLGDSLNISIHGVIFNCRQRIRHLEDDLSQLQPSLGRPKNIAAHRVAEEYGKLYAKVTGKFPTYGESPDGMAGEFTPALRDLFDALGWNEKTLRGPAESARLAVTDEIIRSVEPAENNRSSGLLNALPHELREK